VNNSYKDNGFALKLRLASVCNTGVIMAAYRPAQLMIGR